MNACITAMNLITYNNDFTNYQINAGIIMLCSVYGNGIYFMEQVVTDYAKYNRLTMN